MPPVCIDLHHSAEATTDQLGTYGVNVWLLDRSIEKGECVNVDINVDGVEKGTNYRVQLEVSDHLGFDGCSKRQTTVAGTSPGKTTASVTVRVFACKVGRGELEALTLQVGDGNPFAPTKGHRVAEMDVIEQKPIVLTRSGDFLCRSWNGFSLAVKWNVMESESSGFAKTEILNAKIIHGMPYSPRDFESCIKVKFTATTDGTTDVVINGDMHIVERKLDARLINKESVSSLTVASLLDMYIIESPSSDDPVEEGDSADRLEFSNHRVGYTETGPKLVQYKHLKRPVIYAIGRFSFDKVISPVSAKWVTPVKSLPSICKFNSGFDQSASWHQMFINYGVWLAKEFLVDPYVCSVLFKNSIRNELNMDTPEYANQIADALVDKFIMFDEDGYQ